MLVNSKLVAFVCTTDAARARAFYGGTLGLQLLEESPFALVFDANGTMLRVTPIPELTPAKFTVLGWEVPDIDESVRRLVAAGATFNRYPGLDQDRHGIWLSPSGAQVAWFQDPDGNVLSLTQF